jgi:hypothetical protein
VVAGRNLRGEMGWSANLGGKAGSSQQSKKSGGHELWEP